MNWEDMNMKKYFVSIVLLLPLIAGCKKASGPEVKPVSNDRMKFTASTPAMKSHFNGEGPQLYWDSTDKIAVYGFPAMNCAVNTAGIYATSVSEVLVNPIISDQNTAVFTSSKSVSAWFANPTGTIEGFEYLDGQYIFCAYYPAGNSPKEVQTDYSEAPSKVEYFIFDVPEEQDGESYDAYQILYDPGFSESENEDYTQYFYSKDDVLAGTASISFSKLRPVTSMLRFTLTAPSDISSITLSSLQIILEGDEATCPSIAGDARLPLIRFGGGNGDEWVPYSVISSTEGEYLFATEVGKNSITIENLSLTITNEEPSDYLYVVTLPFRTDASDWTVRFVATDEGGVEYVSRASLPAIPASSGAPKYGFKGGIRYVSDIILNQPAKIVAGNAGSYNEVTIED